MNHRYEYGVSHLIGDESESKHRRKRTTNRRFHSFTIANLIIIILLMILVCLVLAILIFFIVKKDDIVLVWETMRAFQGTLGAVNHGVEKIQELNGRYNLSALVNPERADLKQGLHAMTRGALDLMGLISEIRGSDLVTRSGKLALSIDQILENPENQRSVERILHTAADGLEHTSHEDVRSLILAADFSGLKDCLEVADRIVGKSKTAIDDILRSRADQGVLLAVNRIVDLTKDPRFNKLIEETPEFLHHLTQFIKSDDFKLVVSAGGQVIDRADSILEETEEADLVARGDRVLGKVEDIASRLEGIVERLEDSGINIGIGSKKQRVQSLSPPTPAPKIGLQ